MGSIRKGDYKARRNKKAVHNKKEEKLKPHQKDYTEVAWEDQYYGYLNGSTAGYYRCHTGNTKLLTINRNNGGTLFIGGWSRGAHHTDHMAVIDLTGGKRPMSHRGTYYRISVKDFGVPHWSIFFWESLAMLVYNELLQGDVLIACQGGHGRSGMISSVVSYILSSKRSVNIIQDRLLNTSPIDWIRDIHCWQAVETVAQEILVLETCLEFRDNTHLQGHLDVARSKPRYTFKSKKYDKFKDDWEDEKEIEEDVPFICPICLEEHDTMVEALMCCNTRTMRTCPVCFTKHDLPVNAYNCCKAAPLA